MLIAAATVALLGASPASAQQKFKTPQEAAAALFGAVKTGDTKSVAAILGPNSTDITSSGDAVADKAVRDAFIAGYEQKNQVEMAGDNRALLVIGANNWPVPLPIVRKGDAWQFDSAAGREEILFRRIGRNELAAIQVAMAFVDAQNDYAAIQRRTTGTDAYAQRIISSPGKKDGLYWPTQAGEQPSPLGELAAAASAQGYKAGQGQGRTPFHGYYYKILTGQGPTAPGGAINYVVGDAMIGGFALVAYPAQYGNSGVMTFLVNHDGVIFQKDLGEKTSQIAERMTRYNPDHTWRPVAIEIQNGL
jgi:hypothetical protein